jgi:hypothetical protein
MVTMYGSELAKEKGGSLDLPPPFLRGTRLWSKCPTYLSCREFVYLVLQEEQPAALGIHKHNGLWKVLE